MRWFTCFFVFLAATPVARGQTVDFDVGDSDPGDVDAGLPDAMPVDAGPFPAAPPPAASPPPPPPRPSTGVRGTIIDADTGMPIPDALVAVLRGGEGETLTDSRGRFEIPLPPGRYDLRIAADLYRGRRWRNVIVRRTFTTIDVKLRPDESAVQEVIVEARPDKRTESAGLEERKRAATVRDVISAQEISRTPDSSAGDAVKRVVSATVVGGRYVFIRGLGGRYSMTLLNGVPLPSPEPDQAAVPLDLFPAGLIANLTVVKTYLPDLPGTFSGGALLIETNAYPTDFELKLKLGSSLDTQSTFRDLATYDGGATDALSFDDGKRALPESAPDDRPMRVGTPGIDAVVAERIAEDFSDVWNVEERRALPNLSLSVTAGNTETLRGRDLGWLLSASYSHKDVVQEGTVTATSLLDDGTLTRRQTLASTAGVEQVTVGTLANLGLRLSGRSFLNLFTLYTRSMDDRAHVVTGYSESDSQNIEARRLQFVTRALSFTQLVGDHRFGHHGLRWQANFSYTTRDEPDTRDIKFDLLDDGRRRFDASPGSGERFFSSLEDTSGGAGVDATLVVNDRFALRLGSTGQATHRTFDARRFGYSLLSGDVSLVFLDPEVMLSDAHVGQDFRMEERTLPSDAYEASLLLGGVYLLADIAVLEPLRVIAGARLEHAFQELTSGSPFAATTPPEPGVDRTDTRLLPGTNVVYTLTRDMKLRAGYSYTLARPQFRELAPFLFYDFSRRRAVSGNPDLLDTRIHNADVRWELFPGEREVLAASLFYKRFRDPIEVVIVNASQGDLSFANARGATAIGAELEGRVTLGRLHRTLRDLRLGANLTLIRSNVELGEAASLQTHRSRPLQGQSPYVVNLDFGWSRRQWGAEASLLYNVYGARIAEVGIQGLPDVYEESFHRLDLALGLNLGGGRKLKLGGTNLLNQAVILKQGPIVVQRYEPGISLGASLEWSP